MKRFFERVFDAHAVTRTAMKKQYQTYPSLCRYLPWQEVDDETGIVLLEDGISMGVVMELVPLDCDAKPAKQLEMVAEKLKGVLTGAISLEEHSPWIMQCYVQDERSLSPLYQRLTDYIKKENKGSAFTNAHLAMMKTHVAYVTQEKGLFIDRQVSGSLYQGKVRRIRVALYRRFEKPKGIDRDNALRELQQVRSRLISQLQGVGIKVLPMKGSAFYEWLVRWFNPNPAMTKGNIDALLKQQPYISQASRPFGMDFTRQLFFNRPVSTDFGWRFDEACHSLLTIEGLRQHPFPGHISAERLHGERLYAFFDKFPEGSIFTLTIVFLAQRAIEKHLNKVDASVVGSHAQAKAYKKELNAAREGMEHGDLLYPTLMGVYLKAANEEMLGVQITDMETLLTGHGFSVIPHRYTLCPSDSYLRCLPMAYDIAFDKRYSQRARLMFTNDIAKLLPLYGRARGSDHPGFIFFNRGGEPFCFDPLHPLDKTKNSHMLILGETGTGKSNLLVYLLCQMLAIHNPRLFIIEAGGSFDVFADYLKTLGKTVNHVKIDPKHPISLNPFADGLRLLDQLERLQGNAKQAFKEEVDRRLEEESNAAITKNEQALSDEERDLLGEMIMAAQLMITGGEVKEEQRFMRADRMMLIDAIILAAQTVKKENKSQMIASDVVNAMDSLANTYEVVRDAKKIARIREMADGMRMFCTDPLSRQFFNTPGEPWPLVDVTLLDMGLFARDGYETHRAIAYMGCNNKLLAIAERNQRSQRPIIFASDENHLFAKQPLLAAVQARLTKMGRKLALWVWILTQNMADFPDEARKMLSMLETWLCLAMSPDEIAQIERFKPLTEEERALFLSARKSIGQYTEGVLLGSQYKGLFRNIPPRECLALAMTEQSEKFERQSLMNTHGCSEIEAALMVAKKMREKVPENS